MVLTNIIRASHAEPMSFLQLGKVSGSNTSTATVGLPSLLFGPLSTVAATANLQKDVIFGASGGGGSGYVGNSASTSGSVNFDVSPSETKDFYHGLLTEVDPRTLEFFVQQGISRELLFYLFTEKLVEERNGIVTEIRNDPLNHDEFENFEKFVQLAMNYGLSSEPVRAQKGKSILPKSTAKDAAADAGSGWQLCFRREFMKSTANTDHLEPLCNSGTKSLDGRAVSYRGKHGDIVRLSVYPRSAFAIFQFLGRSLAAGEMGHIELHSADAIDAGPLHDPYLFTVETGIAGPCFLTVDYEGERYCVPMQGASNTKRILSMLSQLIALNTTIGDIPITSEVRVIQ